MTADEHQFQDELVEVADGVHAYVQLDGSWGLNNPGFVRGRDGLAIIDTCFTERRTRAFLDSIRQTADLPITVLANTHHHRDHTNGNYLVDAATIIGHEACRDRILAAPTLTSKWFPGVDWGDLRAAPPWLTFTDRLALDVSGVRIEAIHLGPAHTDNDVVYWLPERKVLFAGDLAFNGGTPFAFEGSVLGALAAMDALRALGPEVIVPGHGAIGGPELLDQVTDYFEWCWGKAKAGRDAGLTPLEAARTTDLGAYAELVDSERLVANFERCYLELSGAPVASKLEVDAIFAKMVEFRGEPLTCHA